MAETTKRPKRPKFNSPKGVLKYPALMKPDFGNKEYPKPDGVYKTKVIFDQDEPAVQAMLAALDVHYQAALEAGRVAFKALKVENRKKLEAKNGTQGITINPLFTVQYDPETEEPTGKIELNFAKKHSGTRKDKTRWLAKPPGVYDARGNPITNKEIKIWGGTIAKVRFEVEPYFIEGTGLTGLKLLLEGAQIIKLVSEGMATAQDMGFGVEDDGFEYDPADDAGFPADDTPPNTGEGADAAGRDDF